jgi:hypothetical protein
MKIKERIIEILMNQKDREINKQMKMKLLKSEIILKYIDLKILISKRFKMI